jgi:hypothetical protein
MSFTFGVDAATDWTIDIKPTVSRDEAISPGASRSIKLGLVIDFSVTSKRRLKQELLGASEHASVLS